MINKSETFQQNKSILSESLSYTLFLRPANLNSYFQSVANSATLKALATTAMLNRFSSFYYCIQPGVSGKAACNFRIVIQPQQEQKYLNPNGRSLLILLSTVVHIFLAATMIYQSCFRIQQKFDLPGWQW